MYVDNSLANKSETRNFRTCRPGFRGLAFVRRQIAWQRDPIDKGAKAYFDKLAPGNEEDSTTQHHPSRSGRRRAFTFSILLVVFYTG
jgi:hypothetical protein